MIKQKFKNFPKKENLNKFYKDCKQGYNDLVAKIKASQINAIDIIFNDSDLKQIRQFAISISSYKKVVVLGVGGSSLGGKTLCALNHNFEEKIEFLESIDPSTVSHRLKNIDFKNTFFLVISKSGETVETICQTLIILDKLKALKVKNFAQQFLFITEFTNNSLFKIAKKIGAETFAHPKIGGRFSCFSIVGLLPAMIAGVDIKKIRAGARKNIDEFLNDGESTISSCASQLWLYEKGFTNNVIMPYIDSLKNFTDWYRQLWAESLGKNNFGSIPINSMGTVDQHSQLQLYLDGPKDKFFTFITAKNYLHDFAVKDLAGCKTLFGAKKLSKIVEVEQSTTIEILNLKKLPIRIFEVDKLNEEELGWQMMQMFLEVIMIANVKNIDPFDQPAVELRKVMAKKILSK